ncbi:MAG: hypothetical protein H0T08_04395 [Acidobacteria bacterium]|nr:hypothetical protein [Acidobacteriota bacterium]
MKFNLTGTPKPEDVGFDDRKGSWKLKYELLLSDKNTIDALISKVYANCKNTAANYSKCVGKGEKKLDKKFKKIALFLSRGVFVKNPILPEAQREIIVPVKFTPEVIRIFNEAAQSAANPVFLLQMKNRVSAKTSTKKKVRYKQAIRFQYPLKLVRRDGSFEFYNVNVFGASFEIDKKSNGGFSYGTFKN